jgi:hypothetical protein
VRIAIYARVSTKGQSCELQLRDLRAYSAKRIASPDASYDFVDFPSLGRYLDMNRLAEASEAA